MIKKTLIAAAAIFSVATFASMPAEAHHNIGLGIGFGFGGYGSCYYAGCSSNIYGRSYYSGGYRYRYHRHYRQSICHRRHRIYY